jgi:sphingomyelin phosphodiesterase acid-like 3
MKLLRPYIAPTAVLFFLGASNLPLTAQQKSAPHVIMLSDIHFDPFHDPGKAAKLRSLPISRWGKVLAGPATPGQAADFDRLQTTCNARGVDTPYVLLDSTIYAMHKVQPKPAFITVSGNIMANQFDCRYHTLFPAATPAETSAFAAKTIEFVAYSLWYTYQDTPIYMALGNTDSSCQDNREDPGSYFLQATSRHFAATTYTFNNRFAILNNFAKYGNYSTLLPYPMHKTRLIVMQDVYQSKKYLPCKASASQTAESFYEQTDWLHLQLAMAKKNHEKVWIMAHIPPGMDAQTMASKPVNMCSIAADKPEPAPDTFLSTEFFANNLDEYSTNIALMIFGHTHMDEVRVFKTAKGEPVPGKIVPALSPVDGNNPAFIVATVDPRNAMMTDYTVYVAGGDRPSILSKQTAWTDEYTFSAIYHLPNLSGASLEKLASSLHDPTTGNAQAISDYQRYYYVNDPFGTANPLADAALDAMKRSWPTYACTMTQDHAVGFNACVCPAKSDVAMVKAPE